MKRKMFERLNLKPEVEQVKLSVIARRVLIAVPIVAAGYLAMLLYCFALMPK